MSATVEAAACGLNPRIQPTASLLCVRLSAADERGVASVAQERDGTYDGPGSLFL